MIQLHDAGTAAVGFVMEENGNDTVTVFVPSTPAFTMGQVYLVTREQGGQYHGLHRLYLPMGRGHGEITERA